MQSSITGRSKLVETPRGLRRSPEGGEGGCAPQSALWAQRSAFPLQKTRNFFKRIKQLNTLIFIDHFFKQARAALGPEGSGGISISPLRPLWTPLTPLETTRGAPLDPRDGIHRFTNQTFFRKRKQVFSLRFFTRMQNKELPESSSFLFLIQGVMPSSS